MIQIQRKQTRCCFCSHILFIPIENEPKQPHHYSCLQNATEEQKKSKGFETENLHKVNAQ